MKLTSRPWRETYKTFWGKITNSRESYNSQNSPLSSSNRKMKTCAESSSNSLVISPKGLVNMIFLSISCKQKMRVWKGEAYKCKTPSDSMKLKQVERYPLSTRLWEMSVVTTKNLREDSNRLSDKMKTWEECCRTSKKTTSNSQDDSDNLLTSIKKSLSTKTP